LLALGVLPAGMAATPAPAERAAEVAAAARTRSYELSFKQMGALFPLQLRGVQGTSGVPFSVRNDEVVVGARLRLSYSYSPALLANLSHINVMVNEEVAASIPVSREQAGTVLTRDIAIPPRLITEFNRLNLQLIGHYTTECEDPAHSSLWANVSNQSTLELTVAPVALANDLALLPTPLFDRRDIRQLQLPFVFPATPTGRTLESAGIVSSWFGGLASYRGAKFPVTVGGLPQRGAAVVFLLGNDSLDGLSLPPLTGPTLSMVANPSDPNAKLLLVMGRNAEELKTAASVLALGSATLSGSTATISEWKPLEPRRPYDAPNWLRSDRPVKFGELAEQRSLNVAGYSPDLIRINFHMPPDLFAWREKGIPVDLRYRYTPRPNPDKSSLNISANEQFLRAYPLRAAAHGAPGWLDGLWSKLPATDGTLPARDSFHIPLFMLPSQTQLQFHYYYDYIKQGACKDVVLDNVRGAIDGDSSIDISGFSHFIAMPDLAAFSNSGFPFTRMADLSETAVILPDAAGPTEWSTYLGLLGMMGASTGYAATGVTVAQAAQADELAGKDLLVLASGSNQPLLQRWSSAIPSSVGGDSKRFVVSDLAYRLLDWWDPQHRQGAVDRRSELQYGSDGVQAVISGFESPLAAGRSVVLVSASQPEGLNAAVDALLDPDRVKQVQGSVAVVGNKQVSSLVAEQSYFVGQLSPVVHVQWFLSRHPLLLVALGVASALLLAVVMYLSLRARARRRLHA